MLTKSYSAITEQFDASLSLLLPPHRNEVWPWSKESINYLLSIFNVTLRCIYLFDMAVYDIGREYYGTNY